MLSGSGGLPVGLALRILRYTQPGRAPHATTLAHQAGLTPRYLALLETDRAPLWPEAGEALLVAYATTERERALVWLTAATLRAQQVPAQDESPLLC